MQNWAVQSRAMPVSSKGFTLLEVLIAISISAGIGVAAVQLLSNASGAAVAGEDQSAELAALQRFNQVVSRDIQQFINRPVRNEYGDSLEGLLLDFDDYPLEFTRTGWRNSPVTENPRSNMQRVAYRTESMDSEQCEQARLRLARIEKISAEDFQSDSECLVRYYWTVLDRIAESEPKFQVVLDQVENLSFELVTKTEDEQGGPPSIQLQSTWPSLSPEDGQVPVAMRWRLTIPKIGDIERVWLIAHDGGAL